VTTVSKLGLIVVAAGFSVVGGGGRALWGWLLVAVGVILGFGPDILGFAGPRLRRRRELAEGVSGWDSKVANVREAQTISLTLHPPSDEEEDRSVSCEVRLPGGGATTPQQDIGWPGTAGHEGVWNDYYVLFFPDGFHNVGAPLPAGEYVVTWSRTHGMGRQVLRRSTFEIDKHGELLS
jgi:hypothetical protein